MFLSLSKRELQHFIMQYVLLNLENFEELDARRDLNEVRDNPDDEDAGKGQWKNEDHIWRHFINFISNRGLENYLKQRQPRYDGIVRIRGRAFAEEVIDMQEGDKNARDIRMAL